MKLMSYGREYDIVCLAILLALPKRDFRNEPDYIHNERFEEFCQDGVQFCDHSAKKG
jgi:hypothetical protein